MKVLTKEQAAQNLKNILPKDIQILSDLFHSAGHNLTLVGGCVRDAFLGKTPKDFDVCTDALPEQIIEILKNANIPFTEQGKAFGVIVSRMTEDIEIASYREDLNNTTDRNTDVRLGVTLEQDLSRRDLTINALALNLSTIEIIDLFGGIKDLNNDIIRTVGEATQRFKEDNLRKLRCMRFASRLGFEIHSDTFLAIKNDPSLNVSEERIINELQNAFETTCDKDRLIADLFDTGLIFTIFKNIWVKDIDLIDTDKITSFTTFIAELISEKNTFRSDIQISKELEQLKFSSKLISGVETLLTFDNIHTLCPIAFTSKLKSTSLTSSEICLFHQHEMFEFAFLFKQEDGLSEKLMAQGITGKELGLKLKQIARQALDDKIMFFTGF